MATPKSAVAPEVVENADVTVSPEGWEWETIEEGAAIKVIFEAVGDTFIGCKLGRKHIDNEPSASGEDRSFDQWEFRGQDGELYAIPDSYALGEAMDDVPDGTWCRITFVREVPTARNQNPMKSFKVDVRK